jgi:hypothetical protein
MRYWTWNKYCTKCMMTDTEYSDQFQDQLRLNQVFQIKLCSFIVLNFDETDKHCVLMVIIDMICKVFISK